ncbi:DUF6083 domain-containing protein [Streptomyces sp. NBC_01451]|uniref:DUF6083 domain-containing protein n=1 Tax=Streptomyces sp. NBC_01451 TaxID=2903872 RepID=UPI003FCC38BD
MTGSKGNGALLDLEIREAPTHLVPVGLRWRVTGNGIPINLGRADPTDTVRVAHRDVCAARPRHDVSRLLAHWRTTAGLAAAQAEL